MKQFIVIACTLLTTSFAFAAEPQEPIQVVCAEKALAAAEVLFKLNTQATEFTSKVELIDVAHVEEGGYEVYDVHFTATDVAYSAYRITTNIEACTIISFEMPFAN